MIIDIHTHIYGEKTYNDYFDKAGGKISKVIAMAWWQDNINDLLDFAAAKNNVFVAATIDIESGIEKQLEALDNLFREKKIVGIKLYPGYQYFYPSDDKIHPIAQLCQKYNRPLIFHSGDLYNQENNALLKYARPIYIDELAVKFPKCKIIISHFGFPYYLETANIVCKNKNVFTDISGTINIDETDSKKDTKILLDQYIADLRRIFSYYAIKNKIMFGTDYVGENSSLREIAPYVGIVKRVFPKNGQDNVFYKLAEQLFFEK